MSLINTDLGYFDIENNEFIITNMHPRRTLKNYLWNEKIVGWYDQFGCGIANGKTSGDFRCLTFDDRLVYIQDVENKQFYSANRNFDNLKFDKFETHVGLGYQRVISEYNGLRVEFTIVIPRNDFAEIMHVKLTNLSNKEKHLNLYTYNKPKVNLTWHDAFSHLSFNEKENGILFTHYGYNVKEKNCVVFTKTNEKPIAWDGVEYYFTGLYNGHHNPETIINGKLSCRGIDFDGDFCNALQFDVVLRPNESKEFNQVTCFEKSEDEAFKVCSKYYLNEQFENELRYQKDLHKEMNAKLVIDTSNPYIDNLENVWLKRQISLGKTWGRVYGKGFRDILQDTSSFLSLDSRFAKEKLLLILSYQRENGNGIRQFDPILDYPYQDGPSWIASTVLAYLKESNDFSILDERVKYYESTVVESVFEHMVRGYYYLLNDLGQHGLVLWRGGDWNDSIEAAGLKGIGESVWVSIATIKGLKDFIEIMKKSNRVELLSDFETRGKKLEQAILDYGFDKDHLIYGIDDRGNKIGSYSFDGPQVFLNPQTWLVLANIGSKELQNSVMDVVEDKLKCDYGYLQSEKSFTKSDDEIGRVTYFAPGTYENASVYNHGVAFKIYADLLLDRVDNAFNSLKLILPINPNNKNNGMEPYAIANMYFGPENEFRPGYSPSSWITGTAGWIYRSISEMILGIHPDYDGIVLDPKLPSEIKEAKIRRTYQGVEYQINIKHNGVKSLTIDGVKIEGNRIKLDKSKKISVIEYQY